MHFFYSFLRRSVDLYNVDSNEDSNKFFLVNSTMMGQIILENKKDIPIDLKMYSTINKVWKEYLNLKFQKKDSTKHNMALNTLINLKQSDMFNALSYLSEFKSSGDTEMRDRKMSWDTFAVEVD